MASSRNTPPEELTSQEELQLAIEHHQAGRLKEAEQVYSGVLRRDPLCATAIHMLGVIAHQCRNNEIGAELISRALAIAPDLAAAESNLGLCLRDLGRLEEAIQCFQRALSIEPNFSIAYFNQGNALLDLGHPKEAVASFQSAIALVPDHADSHLNLGNAFRELGLQEDAARSYRKASVLRPNDDTPKINLGMALQGLGDLEGALSVFQSVNTGLALYKQCICLLAFGEYDRFYELIETDTEKYRSHLGVAAASTFISHQLNRPNPHPFCKNPLDFLRVYEDLDTSKEGVPIRELVKYVKTLNAEWEPIGKTTKAGFQTWDNIFENPAAPVKRLERILKGKITEYHSEFVDEGCDFITKFPKDLQFQGWVVRLVRNGHQTEHIHTTGWLSGVFYLEVPKSKDPEDGAIELGLWGHDYPILDENYPRVRYHPKPGGLVLFPSSLFHATIPHQNDEARLCIAFDLLPSRTR